MSESRPVALPPTERTVGQLVAESIRFYGDRFWKILPLGAAFAGVDLAGLHHSVGVQTLLLWAFAPVFSLVYVRACCVVLGTPWRWRAFWVALLLFLPFPVLVRLYVLPGVIWFGLVGLAVPALLVEGAGVRAALSRGWRLAAADRAHAIGGLAALVLVYGVTRTLLIVLLHSSAGGQGQSIAGVLADLVLSPLVLVGAALLYVDQAARAKGGVGDGSPTARF